MKIFKSNPIQSNPILRKLCLSIAIATVGVVGQTAWACEKPNVSGYDSVRCLKDGLALAKKNNRYNLLDKSGQVVTELTYDVRYYDIGDFEGGLAKIEKHNGSSADITGTFQIRSSGLYGFIDKTGKVVIPIEYDDVDVFSGGMVRVKKRW